VLRRPKTDLSVLAIYVAISFGYVGWRLLPHPGRLLIGGATRDPEYFMWSFAWWPHAIAHALNPFYTRVIYAPTGINLTWTATSPALAIALTPVTLLFGPAVAYNLAAVLLPALTAWTAYFLCRHLTGSLWASLVGGYLFGFSSAILQEELWGNLHMTAAFLLPLIALVLVRYVQGELSGRGLAWRLGVLYALQLWLATEFALTSTVVLALCLLLAFWLIPDVRPRLRSALVPIGAGYVLGAIFAGPFLLYALIGIPPGPFWPAWGVGSDLLNFVLPAPIAAIGGSSLTSISNHFPESSAYLGLPTVLIVGIFAVRGRHTGVARFLVGALLSCVVIALGATLRVDGRKLFPLPWDVVGRLRGFEDVFPYRFALFVALAAAVIVALWTAKTAGRVYARPFLLPVLAVAALVPAVWQPGFRTPALWKPQRLAFFTDGLYKQCIPRNETVMIFPFGINGDSLIYQAETDFRFRMAEDNLQPTAHGEKPWTAFEADWVVTQLNLSQTGLPTMDSLLAFAAIHHVGRFVSIVGDGYPTAAQMRTFGPVERIGGALVSPACGQPALTKRNLTGVVQTYLQERQSQANIDYCLGSNLAALPEGLYPARLLQGATRARFVVGQGLTCAQPPAGYKHRGFATPDMSVPANTYPLYGP
jgi:hypothetical protein